MKNILLSLLMLTTLIYSSEEVPTQEEVAKLYVATFNRAPDSAGLTYWTNGSGLKLSGIASSFFDQPETTTLYPAGTSNVAFITSVYQNLFNRLPDTDGLNYWEAELNAGSFTKNRFIEAVIAGAQNTATSNDADILANKTTVGLSFSEAGLENSDDAKTIMIGVSDDDATMDSAVAGFGISLHEAIIIIQNEVFSTSIKVQFQTIVDNAFTSKVDKAGMTVAIYNGVGDTWTYALGAASSSRTMSPETPVQLYSITKTMTSASILKLIEDGQLSLTDTLSQALAGASDLSSFDSSKINLEATIAQLLSHTSGIKKYNESGITALATSAVFGLPYNPVSLVNLVDEDFSNIGTYHYSDINFILLGMIVEHKTSLALSQVLKSNFFTKLNISGTLLPRDTRSDLLAEPFDDMSVQGGSSEFGNLLLAQPYFFVGMGVATWSAAGMSMTANDVAQWGYGLYSEKGEAISSSLRATLLNSPTEENSNYGYGVTKIDMQLDGNTVSIYGHGGGGAGYLTILYYLPDTDMSIAILVNSNNSSQNPNINTFNGGSLFEICQELFNVK